MMEQAAGGEKIGWEGAGPYISICMHDINVVYVWGGYVDYVKMKNAPVV